MSDQNQELYADIGNRITEESACLTYFIANTLVEIDNSSKHTRYAVLCGDCGFDEIVNKNYYFANNISMASRMEIMVSTDKHESLNDAYACRKVMDKLKQLISYYNKDITYKLHAFLVTINNVLDFYSNEYNIDLSNLKTSRQSWENITEFINENKLKIGQRKVGNNIYVNYIYLDYNGLTIIVLECANNLVQLNYNKDVILKKKVLLRPIYYYNLYKKLAGTNNFPNIEKITKYYNIIQDYLTKNKGNISKLIYPIFNSEGIYIDLSKQNGFKNIINNETVTTSKYVQLYSNIIRSDATRNWYKSLHCYSHKGDRNVNNGLLQLAMFNDSIIYTEKYSKEIYEKYDDNHKKKTPEEYNPNCKGYTPEEIVNHINRCMADPQVANIQNESLPDNPDMIFNMIRFTYPSVYDNKLIEKFRVGDTFSVPTFLSGTYAPNFGHESFSTYNSPYVIFYIRISKHMCSNFIFMEQASFYKTESEVILKQNLRYEIMDIRYKNVKYPRIRITEGEPTLVQKLIITLIIEGDDAARNSILTDLHNSNEWKTDNLELKEIDAPIPIEQVIGGGDSTEISMYQDTNIPTAYIVDSTHITSQNNSLNAIKYTDADKIGSYYVLPDMPYVQKQYIRTGVYTDIEPNLLDLIPGYLRKNTGFPLKNKINGCSYVDPSIVNLIPDLNQIITMPSVQYTIKGSEVINKINSYVDSIFYTLSKDDQFELISKYYFSSKIADKFVIPTTEINEVPEYKEVWQNKAIEVGGASPLFISSMLVLLCILIVYLICILLVQSKLISTPYGVNVCRMNVVKNKII